MPFSLGDRIGAYEVTGTLGAGGMGEVYRARDTKLGRDVALKVLPASFAHDANYVARFQREAQVLASLNHPHIAAIYGVEQNAIVMELVDGRTLADIGKVGLEEALHYALQIAEALEAAHEKGIIHRDLKPANVKVTPEGVVKVLDFGLAKSAEGPVGAAASQSSPTLTIHATQAGVILGTAAYMSPEQAAGKPVDRRADVWSFGVVLFEMLTGRHLFVHETVSETLAAVIRADIDFSLLPSGTPASIRNLLARCLDRKLKTRLQAIGEARIAIDHALSDSGGTPVTGPVPQVDVGSRIAKAAAILFALVSAVSLYAYWRATRPQEKPIVLFHENLGADFQLVDSISGPNPRSGPNVILSPDGNRIVFVSRDSDGKTRLYTRRLDQSQPSKLAGTDHAIGPFFSPNGQWVGFFSGGRLKKVSMDGGSVLELCATSGPISGAWADDGRIFLSLSAAGPLFSVPETGGTPQPVTKLAADENTHRWAHVLPGSKIILYAAGVGGNMSQARIVAQRLDTGERKVVHSRGSFPRYLTSGHLLFVSMGAVYAVAFDPERLETRGTPSVLLQDVKQAPDSGGAQLDVSGNGTLIFRSAGRDALGRVLSWVSRDGKVEDVLTSGFFNSPSLSSDGKRLLYRHLDNSRSGIWVYDFEQKRTRRLTFEASLGVPRWSPDGRYVLYVSREGMHAMRGDGTGSPLRIMDHGVPSAVSRDGSRLLYVDLSNPGGPVCRILPVSGSWDHLKAGTPEPCFAEENPKTPRFVTNVEFSPDSKWIAFIDANEGQLMVSSYPDRGGKWQISTGGAWAPRWSHDGRTLYFIDPGDRIMECPIEIRGDSVVAGEPKPFTDLKTEQVSGLTVSFSPSLQRDRLLVLRDASTAAGGAAAQVVMVLNFGDEVRRRTRGGTQ